MQATVSKLHKSTKNETKRVILKDKWGGGRSKWYEQSAVAAIWENHYRIRDSVSVGDVIPEGDVICIYGIQERSSICFHDIG